MRCFNFNKSNLRGQVWVETVVYTLIGLTILGILLVASKPKLDEMKDRNLIDQAINSLGKIHEEVENVGSRARGNVRKIELNVGKGAFYINGTGDSLYWEIETGFMFSEENAYFTIGVANVTTIRASPWKTKLKVEYPNYNITFNEQNNETEFFESSAPYTFYVERLGVDENGKVIINFFEEN